MDFEAAVRDLIALLDDGEPLAAIDRYFADDCVVLDNDEPVGHGKDECRANQEGAMAGSKIILGNITNCAMDVEDEICVFRNRSTLVNEAGEETHLDAIHWQRWSDGKIVEERCYRGAMMADKIAQGMLDQGDDFYEDEEDLGPPQPPVEETPMRNALLAALAELVRAEQVEIVPDATGLVADELVLAMLEGHNPRHALKKLRLALIHSEHIEEVYADDLTLEAAFRRAMGG